MQKSQYLLLCMVSFFACIASAYAQNHQYYIRAASHSFDPPVKLEQGKLSYQGADKALNSLFDDNPIMVFEKAFPTAQTPSLQRTFYVECSTKVSLDEFLVKRASYFEFGEYMGTEEPQLQYVTNDYGSTSPTTNQGLAVDLHYLDYIDVQTAWDYTYFRPGVLVGISDGRLLEDDPEFINKTQFVDEFTDSTEAIHGTGVSAIVAAQGNNGHGMTGVCYDCGIVKTRFNSFYNGLMLLAQNGARVINASWAIPSAYSQTQQNCINEITNLYGATVVAASGNLRGILSNYDRIYYPASYDNVISVGSVAHVKDPTCSNITYPGGTPHIIGAKDYLGADLRFNGGTVDCNLPIEDQVSIEELSTVVLNSQVDIVAPSGGTFRYGKYVLEGGLPYTSQATMHTSNSTPQVTGTIGLMLSINDCLDFNEIESILKIASKNIDYLPANQDPRYVDRYGSGSLKTGEAAKLTFDLKTFDHVAYLQNQSFSRWDFTFNALSRDVVLRDQAFTDSSTVTVNARNRINLEDGTLLEPDANGFAIFEIDPGITVGCIPPGPTTFKSSGFTETESEETPSDFKIKVVPNPSRGVFKVHFDQELHNLAYTLYNSSGGAVLSERQPEAKQLLINKADLPAGVYILNITSQEGVKHARIVKY